MKRVPGARRARTGALLVAALALHACHRAPAPEDRAAAPSPSPAPAPAPADPAPPAATAAPLAAPDSGGGFQPLQSQKVKDAIHAALDSGTTQRWSDGAYSGYAVPGAPGAHGCRQVRYTIDQRPADLRQITACDASRPGG